MDNNLICPNCKTEIERKYGLPAITYTCPGCGKGWIMCLGKLVSREQFHERAEAEQ